VQRIGGAARERRQRSGEFLLGGGDTSTLWRYFHRLDSLGAQTPPDEQNQAGDE
jgi:hypothetical protein